MPPLQLPAIASPLTTASNGDRFTSLSFTSDSQRLVIGTTAGELQIWQPTTSG